jgi:hypothetical protein
MSRYRQAASTEFGRLLLGQYKQEEMGVPAKKPVGPTNSEELLNDRIQAVQQRARFGFTRLIDCNSIAVHYKSLPGQFLEGDSVWQKF